MSFSGQVAVTGFYSQSSISGSGGSVTETFNDQVLVSTTANGTKAWSYEADGGIHNANMGSSSSLTFTLSALTGPLGTVAFAHVLSFVFINHSTTDSITLGGAATHPWGPLAAGIVIPPGGAYVIAAPVTGWAVTSGSADQVLIATGTVTNPVPFSLGIEGN